MDLLHDITRPPWITPKKYSGKTVLVTQAHTDDADWNCGGTVAKLSAAGAHVIYVVATEGEAGSIDPDMTPERLVAIRRAEQAASNEILGVSETIYLGHQDGRLDRVQDLDSEIAALIRKFRPGLILTFDPAWPEYKMHPDHRAISLATLRAAVFSTLTLTYTEGETAEPFRCNDILLYEPLKPAIWVDIRKYTFPKLKALASHESQMVHLLPDWLHKIMYSVLEAGDRPSTRAAARMLHYSFMFESFKRYPVGLLR